MVGVVAQAINPLAPPINLLKTVITPKLGEKKVQVRKGGLLVLQKLEESGLGRFQTRSRM